MQTQRRSVTDAHLPQTTENSSTHVVPHTWMGGGTVFLTVELVVPVILDAVCCTSFPQNIRPTQSINNAFHITSKYLGNTNTSCINFKYPNMQMVIHGFGHIILRSNKTVSIYLDQYVKSPTPF